MHARRILTGSRLSEPALQGTRGSTFELASERRAVAVLRRFGVRTALAMLVATGFLALGSFTQSAAAQPMCNVPDPPPICEDDEEEPELLRFTATSQHGTVAISQGEAAQTREAWSNQPLHLRGALTGVSPARSARLQVTESWRCAPGYEWSNGTVTTTAAGAHTVADPSERCPHSALYWDRVTAFAYDPQGHVLPTGELTIWVYGNYWPDDWMPPWPLW